MLAPGAQESDQTAPRTQVIVDQNPLDRSFYGVFNMAGNISEWTADLVPSSIISSMNVPVIRGGNFLTRDQEQEKLTFRNTRKAPSTREFSLGFRCASDTIPAPPK